MDLDFAFKPKVTRIRKGYFATPADPLQIFDCRPDAWCPGGTPGLEKRKLKSFALDPVLDGLTTLALEYLVTFSQFQLSLYVSAGTYARRNMCWQFWGHALRFLPHGKESDWWRMCWLWCRLVRVDSSAASISHGCSAYLLLGEPQSYFVATAMAHRWSAPNFFKLCFLLTLKDIRYISKSIAMPMNSFDQSNHQKPKVCWKPKVGANAAPFVPLHFGATEARAVPQKKIFVSDQRCSYFNRTNRTTNHRRHSGLLEGITRCRLIWYMHNKSILVIESLYTYVYSFHIYIFF